MGISLGLQHWKGLQVPRQTTYISYHSRPKPKISYGVVGFFSLLFICFYTKVKVTFWFCWHGQFQFIHAVPTEAGLLLNRNLVLVPCSRSWGWFNRHFRGCTSQNPATLAKNGEAAPCWQRLPHEEPTGTGGLQQQLLCGRIKSEGTKSKPGTWSPSHPSEAYEHVHGPPGEVGKHTHTPPPELF